MSELSDSWSIPKVYEDMKKTLLFLFAAILAGFIIVFFMNYEKNSIENRCVSKSVTPEHISELIKTMHDKEEDIWILVHSEQDEYYKGIPSQELDILLNLEMQEVVIPESNISSSEIQLTILLGEKFEIVIDKYGKIFVWYGYNVDNEIAFVEYSNKIESERVLYYITNNMTIFSNNGNKRGPIFYFD